MAHNSSPSNSDQDNQSSPPRSRKDEREPVSGPHARPKSAPWSITLLTVKEIPIRVHLSFFLLVAFVAFLETSANGHLFSRLLFLLGFFACVLLHELGHALTARIFKIRTRDIVLYPFGGIATLMSEGKPRQEFFIALAGPLVNLVIAAAIGPFIEFQSIDSPGGFLSRLFLGNIALAFFNLIPALPMDGGRVLRAILAMAGISRATSIAARISQVLCILMALVAFFYGNIILGIIAGIIFSQAVQEHVRDRTRGIAIGHKVRDVMIEAEQMIFLQHGMTASKALKIVLKSLQTIFPVMHGSEVIGVIDREALLQVGALEAEESYLSGHMSRHLMHVKAEDDLSTVVEKMQAFGVESLLVMEEGKVLGLLLKESVLEYLLVQDFRTRTKAQARSTEGEF